MPSRLLKAGILVLLAALAVALVRPGKSRLPDEIDRVEGVAQVERLVSVTRPAHTILHIADFHLVSPADYAAYLRQTEPGISDAEIEEEFLNLKATVRVVQANQLRLIQWLAKEHDVRVVYLEGLLDRDEDAYATMVRLVRIGKLDHGMIGARGRH